MFGRTKKEIRIHEKYETELWAVEVDRGQIQQVLMNLYVNAWQAMPGGGDLYIRTESVTLNVSDTKGFSIPPGRFVKTSITDTGIGMDDVTREKIFDPFFSTKGKGSGLGLSSVYGIIKNHGGFIDVYGEKGIGTTFDIYLPASNKDAVDVSSQTGEGTIKRGNGTVLLVDDENMIIDVGRAMLEKLGYSVLIARNGQEALDVYEKHRKKTDLIILDMIMPDMGGGEIYDRLKKFDGDVKVLLSSGYSINGQANEIMKRGCKGFIQKPFSIKDLSFKIQEALGET
jgi:CheY-like chemotaxis protein